MVPYRTICTSAAVIALTACGGGGGGGSAPAPVTSAPTAPTSTPASAAAQPIGAAAYKPPMSAAWLSTPPSLRVLHIAMYGDSTIFGCTDYVSNVCTQVLGNEPNSIQTMFNSDFGPGRVVVENHGVGGTTCPELVSGASPENSLGWTAEMANSDAQLITANDAINDGESDEEFTGCYQLLAQTALTAGKAFIIEGPNPTSLAGTLPAHLAGDTADEIAVSIQFGTPYIPMWADILTFYANWQGDEPDGVHPDPALYWYKALITYQTLKPIALTMLNAPQQ